MAKKKIGQREGAGLSKGHEKKDQSSDKELFLAIRSELSSIKGVALTSPTAVDLPTVIVLAEEIRTKLDAVAALVELFEA